MSQHCALYSHASLNNGDTFWEMHCQAFLSLCESHIECTYTNLDSITHYTPRLYGYSLLLLGYKPVQHVTVLNTVGKCDTLVSIIILWDYCRICSPSLTKTSLCGARPNHYAPLWTVVHNLMQHCVYCSVSQNGGLENPPPGTVMDHTITRRNWYDFFLVSQHVRQVRCFLATCSLCKRFITKTLHCFLFHSLTPFQDSLALLLYSEALTICCESV